MDDAHQRASWDHYEQVFRLLEAADQLVEFQSRTTPVASETGQLRAVRADIASVHTRLKKIFRNYSGLPRAIEPDVAAHNNLTSAGFLDVHKRFYAGPEGSPRKTTDGESTKAYAKQVTSLQNTIIKQKKTLEVLEELVPATRLPKQSLVARVEELKVRLARALSSADTERGHSNKEAALQEILDTPASHFDPGM